MPASRDDRRIVAKTAALAALLTALALAMPAGAQLGPPVRLIPPPTGAAQPMPRPAAQPAASPITSNDASGVEATPLAPIDATWAGPLGTADGAFPETMWQGTSRSLVAGRLAQLQPTISPVLQDLTRRLLLSNARPPGGDDPPQGPSLGVLRLERLMALGQIEGALGVADLVRTTGDAEPLDRLRVELHFAGNDREGACGLVRAAIGRYQDFWWDRALIACQALGGEQAEASVGLSLLQERKAPREPIFDTLVEAVGGRRTKLERLPDPTPIRVALLAAAKLPLPADALQAASPAVLHEWASNSAVPAENRLPAAERAAAVGALSLDTLRGLYGAIAPTQAERKSVLGRAGADTPRARAVLYAMAEQETTPVARAELLSALLEAGRKRGYFLVLARMTAPLWQEMRPSPDLQRFAPLAARALYGAGEVEAAEAWLPLADAELETRLASIERRGIGIAPEGARLFGETVLGVLVAAQQDGHLTADPVVVEGAATALGGIGLEREARQLEIEAALAAGP